VINRVVDIPPPYIDLTRALMLVACYIAIHGRDGGWLTCLREHLKFRRANSMVIAIPRRYQNAIYDRVTNNVKKLYGSRYDLNAPFFSDTGTNVDLYHHRVFDEQVMDNWVRRYVQSGL
jgi:hypothetical protein